MYCSWSHSAHKIYTSCSPYKKMGPFMKQVYSSALYEYCIDINVVKRVTKLASLYHWGIRSLAFSIQFIWFFGWQQYDTDFISEETYNRKLHIRTNQKTYGLIGGPQDLQRGVYVSPWNGLMYSPARTTSNYSEADDCLHQVTPSCPPDRRSRLRRPTRPPAPERPLLNNIRWFQWGEKCYDP